MKILYVGQFNDACGYANAARKYLSIFDRDDFFKKNLVTIPVNAEKKNYASDEETKLINKYYVDLNALEKIIDSEEYIALIHFLPDVVKHHEIIHRIVKKAKKSFNIVYWETDRLPQQWIDLYKTNVFSEIIVNSEWNKTIFERDTGLKVNLTYLPYEKRDISFVHGDKFTVFGMSQWVYRKGFDVLIKSFVQEFFYNNDVQMFIKTYRFETTSRDSEEKEKAIIINDANQIKKTVYDYGKNSEIPIYLITGHISEERLVDLYKNSNVFISTARSEGFGMTIADACSFGIPVIALNKTGHVDFLDKDSSFLFNGHLVPISNQPFHLNSLDMNFYEPDILSVREQLRKAYNLWKEDKSKLLHYGQKNREYAISILNENKIINDFKRIFGVNI